MDSTSGFRLRPARAFSGTDAEIVGTTWNWWRTLPPTALIAARAARPGGAAKRIRTLTGSPFASRLGGVAAAAGAGNAAASSKVTMTALFREAFRVHR